MSSKRKCVCYYRVSTQKQGASGLGIEAQQKLVASYLNGDQWEVLDSLTEIETGKGADALAKRPQLRSALALCKKRGATLVIAKLDRLARNVHFISGLLETGVDFVAADMPQANKVMIQMHAVMSEWERDEISKRTKAALAAAKERGVILGATGPANLKPNIEARQKAADTFAQSMAPLIAGFKAANMTQRRIVDELNRLGLKTARGGEWSLMQLQRVISRNFSRSAAQTD